MFRRGLAEAGSDINFSLACLPGCRGGLGFKNPDFVHGAAFLASNLCYAREEEVEAHFWPEIRDAWENFCSFWNRRDGEATS